MSVRNRGYVQGAPHGNAYRSRFGRDHTIALHGSLLFSNTMIDIHLHDVICFSDAGSPHEAGFAEYAPKEQKQYRERILRGSE